MCARSSLPVGGETIVQVRDLGVTYPERAQTAPDGVTFDLQTGEVALLLGPSGAGKSTLALTLDGLIPHEVSATVSGSVIVAGTDVARSRVAQIATDVAMVFQDSDAQIVAATVLDEACFGLENLQRPREEVLAAAERALRRVDLWDRRRDDPGDLSGGGRQRLAIACALALGSRVIVLDEPTANLDPQGVVDVYALLGEIAAERTHAILLIEHNLDEAMSIVDRVIVLDSAGRVRFDGPARSILETYADEIDRLGVWLPVSTVAGRRLGLRTLPLTPAELTAAVDAGVASGALPTVPSAVSQSADAGAPVVDGVPSGEAALEVRHLSAHAHGRDRPLVDDVSLQVPRGALVAIVGRNGAGKTTLLHRMAGVVSPPQGSVHIYSAQGMIDVTTASPRRLAREVGFVFQNPEHQFITPTVVEELAHGLSLQGLGEDEITARVEAMLRRLGLQDCRETHPYLLSGGQKRRLSVGTALITGAPVLCLDEPTYGQDQARAAELVTLLRELVDTGSTVVIVTHDMQLVTEQATHVAVMNDGRVETFGPTEDVLAGDALERAGLLRPPLARAMAAVAAPAWHGVTRLQQLESLRTGAADTSDLLPPTVPTVSRSPAFPAMQTQVTPASAEHRPRRRPKPRPTTTSMFDPAVPAADRPRWAPLATLNPVAKLIAMMPLTIVALALHDIGALLGMLAVVLAVVIVGSGAGWRRLTVVIGGILIGVSVLSISVGVWMDPAKADQQQTLWQIGDWRFTVGMWLVGLGVTLRVGTVAALGMLPGLTATGVDTIRALVRRLHVPYRLGYTALAAYRFVPRFGKELEQIRRAHRVRGVSNGRGPVAALRRAAGYALPLLASGIRHAERVALSMDARAFGAGSSRTERYEIPWRTRDWVFVVGFWALVVAGLLIGAALLPVSV
ncbi:energy-coupling factor transporter ATPase [Pseudoclavibacter sp. CFCC 11306]|uniref:energy-coupling factor transporter ATPase n=1 Tax=Pseudoclavibacter sp. CFCC 11306 TaxID=1564493 RepID=UPI0013013889|nr:energy-coupling factor transporter ATPase [Pseudoclavibacter sp. CFCC 11306]KAB1659107.1 ATP-binding cassette domain-containing protein [Pseudoclavibacter sp. CFCC 11306]